MPSASQWTMPQRRRRASRLSSTTPETMPLLLLVRSLSSRKHLSMQVSSFQLGCPYSLWTTTLKKPRCRMSTSPRCWWRDRRWSRAQITRVSSSWLSSLEPSRARSSRAQRRLKYLVLCYQRSRTMGISTPSSRRSARPSWLKSREAGWPTCSASAMKKSDRLFRKECRWLLRERAIIRPIEQVSID